MINTYIYTSIPVRPWLNTQSGSEGQPLGPSRAVFTQGQQQGEYGHWGKGLRGRSRSHSLNGVTFTGVCEVNMYTIQCFSVYVWFDIPF